MPHFTFIPRQLPLTFFSDDPIHLTLPMGDAMDALLAAMAKNLDAAETAAQAEAALHPVLGQDATEKILSRANPRDRLAACQLAAYVLRQYAEGKEKNLLAAQSGRQMETGSSACQTD